MDSKACRHQVHGKPAKLTQVAKDRGITRNHDYPPKATVDYRNQNLNTEVTLELLSADATVTRSQAYPDQPRRVVFYMKEFMDKKHNTKDGESPNVHPEYWWLRKLNHEGMLSIRIENPSYTGDSEGGRGLRERFTRLLMYNLRQKWKLRKLDCYWWGCSEYGQSGEGHLHVLFSFEYMRRNSKTPPDLEGFEDFAKESAEHIRKQVCLPSGCVDLKWSPTTDNEGLVEYFCKREWGKEDYKHFFPFADSGQFARWLIEEILEDDERRALDHAG